MEISFKVPTKEQLFDVEFDVENANKETMAECLSTYDNLKHYECE